MLLPAQRTQRWGKIGNKREWYGAKYRQDRHLRVQDLTIT